MSASAFWPEFYSNSLTYKGQSAWDAMVSTLWEPLIAVLDKHPSTVSYGLMNEPNYFGSLSNLQNYVTYISQKIRDTIRSKTMIVFQTNAGGGGNVSSVCPSPNLGLGPFAMEAHNFQLTYDPYGSWKSQCDALGIGLWHGEWNTKAANTDTAQITSDETHFIQAAKDYKMATSYFSWTSGGSTGNDLLDSKNQPDLKCQILSQLYNQILGTLP